MLKGKENVLLQIYQFLFSPISTNAAILMNQYI